MVRLTLLLSVCLQAMSDRFEQLTNTNNWNKTQRASSKNAKNNRSMLDLKTFYPSKMPIHLPTLQMQNRATQTFWTQWLRISKTKRKRVRRARRSMMASPKRKGRSGNWQRGLQSKRKSMESRLVESRVVVREKGVTVRGIVGG